MSSQLSVSIVICTRNRVESLARTLQHLERQDYSHLQMEVIVVNNGSIDTTEELLRLKRPSMPLVPLYEPIPSKSRSLNLALTRVTGRIIIFTDDDVSFAHDWVRNYMSAADRFGTSALFCGPIVPEFPPGVPPWILSHKWSSPFFGTFNADRPEGPLPIEFVPLGGNFAVRTDAITGMQFRVDLGPSALNGRLMGEDVEFTRRIRNAWQDCVYVPSAPVRHHIRPEQISPPWLFDRAFTYGRSVMLLKHDVTIATFDPQGATSGEEAYRLDEACLIHFYCGQLAASHEQDTSQRARIRDAISSLDFERYQELLIPEARDAFGRSKELDSQISTHP